MKRRILIAGFGMAAQRLLEELAPLEVEGLQVTVLSEEPCVAYDRIKLSTVLAGRAAGTASSSADLSLKPAAWHAAHGFELRLGQAAESIDLSAKTVRTEQGETLEFDDLVLATGSRPIVPPLPGVGFEGVHVFRRLSDCEALAEQARPGLEAIVVGGGLLGLEAAKGLLNLGCKVTVVHLADRLMERQLDAKAAQYLQKDLEAQGLRFELEASTEALLGEGRIEGLRLATGRVLPAQMVVFAIGVKPETSLAQAAGLVVKRGIVVDDHLQTSIPGVWAVGECAEHRGVAYGLVAPLYEQAATLAKRLAGMEKAPYAGSKVYTKLKVAGLEVFSCGELGPSKALEATRDLVLEDAISGQYKRAVFVGTRLKGAVLYGDSTASNRLLKALDLEDGIAEVRAALGLNGAANGSALAGMKDGDLVCNCNQVSLGTLKQAVKAQGCNTLAKLQTCTAASTSCGSCKGLVESILKMEMAAPSPAVAATVATAPPAAKSAVRGLTMVGGPS